MNRVETIGDATLYLGLTRSQRHRLRKKGLNIPFVARSKGYKQTAEHVEKRKRTGSAHYAWKGDAISEKGGRKRALKQYPVIGVCKFCGSQRAERHHKDGNTANNAAENIEALCRRCHMVKDGRMERVKHQWQKK